MKQLLAWTGSADSTITSEAVMAMAEKFNPGQEVCLQIPSARGVMQVKGGDVAGLSAPKPSGHGHATNNAPHVVRDTIVSAASPNIVSQKRSIGVRVSVATGRNLLIKIEKYFGARVGRRCPRTITL